MSRGSAYARTLRACIAAGTWVGGQALAGEVSRSSTTTSYDVAPDCPDQAAWRDALRTRLTEKLRRAAAMHDFTVKIERRPSREGMVYLGQLAQLSEPDLEPRRVQGTSCQDVVEALSLIAAMAAPVAAPSENPEAPSGRWVSTAEQEQALAREEDTGLEPELALQPVRVGAVGFVLFQSVAAPRLAADLGLGISMSWQTESWQPWVLVGVYWGGERIRVPGTAAEARFDRWSSHIVACPLRLPHSSALAIRPCLDVDVGKLNGAGIDVRGAAQTSALWASAGLELRLDWSIWERLELGAMVGSVVALARPRFYFVPEFTALEVQGAGVRASTSASLIF